MLTSALLAILSSQSPAEPPHPQVIVKNRRLGKGQPVAKALYAAGLEESTVSAVEGALEAAEFDFRKARVGDQLRFVFRDGELDVLDYRRSAMVEWQVRREGERYLAARQELEKEQRVELVELLVEGSVWDAAKAAGERPDVAVTLSDVFAWDIDFYRDVQRGDRMRAVIEKVMHKGRVVEYGHVLAAEYIGQSVGTKRTFRYQLPDGTETYFGADGSSSRKTFLKSPLKFAAVTSGFGGRPSLAQWGVHNGVDYHAPVGTPVWAVADGTVSRAGWDQGGGNMVCVKHVKSFESCYLHLSKIDVHVGERVAQKRVIAESGNTGLLTTGPHLHFGLRRGGAWVNPLNQNFPRADPLPKPLMPAFQEAISDLGSLLDSKSVASVRDQRAIPQ